MYYRRLSDGTVWAPGFGVRNTRILVSSINGVWKAEPVDDTVLAEQFEPYRPPVAAGQRWADETGFTVEVDAVFTSRGTTWVARYPLDAPERTPEVISENQFRRVYELVDLADHVVNERAVSPSASR